MAISFLHTYHNTLLSADVPDMVLHSDAGVVNVVIRSQNGTQLLNETYYTTNNLLTITDLPSLFEQYMQTNELTVCEFTILAVDSFKGMVVTTLSVLYCERHTFSFDAARDFLTPASVRHVPQVADYLLYFIPDGSNLNGTISALVRVNGQVRSHVMSVRQNANGSLRYVSISHTDLMADCAKANGVSPWAVSLISYTVSVAGKTAVAIIDDKLTAADLFIYRNCFNVPECIWLGGVTTEKTEVKRSEAVINGVTRQYDRRVSKTYTLESWPITHMATEQVSQLVASHTVMRPMAGSLQARVIITDSTCEMADSDEDLNTVKLTWRYDKSRPVVAPHDDAAVFTDPFNYMFD